MTYQGGFVPRPRRFKPKVILAVLLILLVLALALYLTFFQEEKEVIDTFSFCNMNSQKSYEVLRDLPVTNTKLVRDYGQYGDSLGLYEEEYRLNARDALDGKTLFMHNLCTGEEHIFMNNVNLDEKIMMSSLADGFYVIEVLEGLDRYTLLADQDIDMNFHSVSKNNYYKNVNLISKANLFDKDEWQLEHQFLLLSVSGKEENNQETDIILDPNGLYFEWDGSPNFGAQYGSFKEAYEMMDIAKGVKAILEEAGYRVALSRDDENARNINGTDGRLYHAYEAKAKYYINLRVLVSDYAYDEGVTIMYSHFSSNRFATILMKQLMQDTSLEASSWASDNNIDGVYRSGLVNNTFDYIALVREAGGRFTGAGEADPEYAELNSFAKGKNLGMNALVVEYGYLSDKNFYNQWLDEKEAVIQATAQGILKYLSLE